MKKLVVVLLVLTMALSLVSVASAASPIRIYSNSNSTERVNWLVQAAQDAGFTISIDDNSVISGDTAAVQAANENKDGDLIFGLNEVRWSQLVNGQYENLKVLDWAPTGPATSENTNSTTKLTHLFSNNFPSRYSLAV